MKSLLVLWVCVCLMVLVLAETPRRNLQIIRDEKEEATPNSRSSRGGGRSPQPPSPPPGNGGSNYDLIQPPAPPPFEPIHPPAPPPFDLIRPPAPPPTTLRPPGDSYSDGYHYGVRRPTTARPDPQPPAPPPEDSLERSFSPHSTLQPPPGFIPGPQPPRSPGDAYGLNSPLPTIESNRRPTSTELTKVIQLLEDAEGPGRAGRFYNYQVVKSVPVPAVLPVRAYIRPYEDPPLASEPALRVDATDISCFQTATRTRFRAVLVPSRPLVTPPVLENRVPGGRCDPLQHTGDGRGYFIDMTDTSLEECGVQQCPENGETRLCLAVRFPTIRGLKLPEDVLMSIQCRTQDRFVEQSRTLRFSTVGRPESRAAPLVAVGGLRYDFHSQMGLYRRPTTGGAFTQRMSPGGSVQLGEELQLRCDVRSGDGWQYSRFGDIVIHRANQDGLQTQDSIVLVNSDGCRNPQMKSICPHHPRRDSVNPLSTSFNWRAFMFQEMREGEELVVSTRMIACLEEADCQPECYGLGEQQGRRTRRDLSPHNRTTDWSADLSFRVVLHKVPEAHARTSLLQEESWVLPTLSAVIAFMSVAILLVAIYIYRSFIRKDEHKPETQEYLNIKWPPRFDID